jgi:hypothetical protein
VELAVIALKTALGTLRLVWDLAVKYFGVETVVVEAVGYCSVLVGNLAVELVPIAAAGFEIAIPEGVVDSAVQLWLILVHYEVHQMVALAMVVLVVSRTAQTPHRTVRGS